MLCSKEWGASRQGWAQIIDGKTVAVMQDGKEVQRISCEHLLIASGSNAVELPFMPFGSGDGKVISSTEALSLKTDSEKAGGRWWRLYRAGTRHYLSQAG